MKFVVEDIFDRVYQAARAMGTGLNRQGQASSYRNTSDPTRLGQPKPDKSQTPADLLRGTDLGLDIYKLFADNVDNILEHYKIDSLDKLAVPTRHGDKTPKTGYAYLDKDALSLVSPDRAQQITTALSYTNSRTSSIYKDIISKGPWVSADVFRLALAAYKQRVHGFYGNVNIINTLKQKLSKDPAVAYSQLQWITYLIEQGANPQELVKSKLPTTDKGWLQRKETLNKRAANTFNKETQSLLDNYKKLGYDITPIVQAAQAAKSKKPIEIDPNALKTYFWVAILKEATQGKQFDLQSVDMKELAETLVKQGRINLKQKLPTMPQGELGKYKDRVRAYSDMAGMDLSAWEEVIQG